MVIVTGDGHTLSSSLVHEGDASFLAGYLLLTGFTLPVLGLLHLIYPMPVLCIQLHMACWFSTLRGPTRLGFETFLVA